MLRLLTAIALAGSMAIPANALEFKKDRIPSFVDLGLSLAAVRGISGLTPDVDPALISMAAEAHVTAICINEAGNAKPTKQAPADIVVAGTAKIGKRKISDAGLGLMAVVTQVPPLEIVDAPDCNNANFSEVITDLSFTKATIIVTQVAASFTATCTFASPTADGAVPKADVSCVVTP